MTTKQFLTNCWHDGQYITDHVTCFWSVCDTNDSLAGEPKWIGPDIACQPLKLIKQRAGNVAMLVSVSDTNNKTYYAWIYSKPIQL